MSTMTLARPGRRPGALVAANLDPRPCVTNPPQWWDTGHAGNGDAIRLCNTACPLKTVCAADTDQPIGVIRAGIPYDDDGRRLNTCTTCDHPVSAWSGAARKMCRHCPRDARPVDHHQRIAELRAAGKGYAEIADDIGAHREAVRAYWMRYQQRAERQAQQAPLRPLLRLPAVAGGQVFSPREQRDVVIAMLTDPAAYTHADVAWVIGSTTDAVRTYWSKRCREYHHLRPLEAVQPLRSERVA